MQKTLFEGIGARVHNRKREQSRRNYQKHKDARLESTRRWGLLNPEKRRLSSKKAIEKRKQRDMVGYKAMLFKRNLKLYNLTPKQWDEMHAAQGGKCAICKNLFPSRRLTNVDHDHNTGQVRALLCLSCNSMIGHSKENPEVLVAGAAYLQKFIVQHQVWTIPPKAPCFPLEV